MLLQQVWLLTVLLMVCALSGWAQNSRQPNKPLICYDGSHVNPFPLTADFPKGLRKCVSDGSYFNKTCAEYRMQNSKGGFAYTTATMFCGDCRNAEDGGMECRQCDTDLCNDKWARELLPFISEMRHCYMSVQIGSAVMPQRVLCPRNESCLTSTKPGYNDHQGDSERSCDTSLKASLPRQRCSILHFQYTMVGCEPHCEKFKWRQCEYCDTDLCNRHGETYQVAERGTASDQAVCVSSPVTRSTAQVVVLAVVAALALRRLRQ